MRSTISQMTSKERIVNALEGKPVDHLPFSPFLAYVWEYFPQEIQDMGMEEFHRHIGADPMWRGTPCPTMQITDGVATHVREDEDAVYTEISTPVGSLDYIQKKSTEGSTLFLIEHPLKTEDDFKVLMWIEENARIIEADQEPIRKALASDGLAVGLIIARSKTAFQQLVEHYVGTEELIYAMYDFPDTVDSLLNVMIENDLKSARMAIEYDYTHFLTFEDSSTQNYSPAMYRKYIMPEITKLCEIVHDCDKAYMQHACGHVRDLLEPMKESGVDAVESISPPPTGNISVKEARSVLGSEVGIVGGIEPTHLLNLSMNELSGYVEHVIDDLHGGPFVLANSDSCPPGVTIDKFIRIAELAQSHPA